MKIGIVTFTEGFNYGNKLQNYALRKYLEECFLCDVRTVNNCIVQGKRYSKIKLLLVWAIPSKKHYMYWKRLIRFKWFNKEHLKLTKERLTLGSREFSEVDCFVCGSDQIWNPNYYGSIDLLTGNLAKPKRSISYAASFGIDEIPEDKREAFAKALRNLEAVSVREEQATVICKHLGVEDCTVNIDPTFLLSKDEWLRVIERPKKEMPERYAMTYFLGEIKKKDNDLIDAYCRKNGCKRLDLNSIKNPEWYDITPFEFLYVIKNSEFVFTDSFHASVFSIIFGKLFLTAERTENHERSMNSRIDTLFSLFSCKNHKMERFHGEIDELIMNESRVNDVIDVEKNRAHEYFARTLFK